SRMHAQCDGIFGRLPDVVSRLSLQRRQRALQRPGMGAVVVLLDSDSARNPRRRDRSARAHDDLVRTEGQLSPPPPNRAMDVAAVDVRVGDGRDLLPDAVQDLPANLSTAGDSVRDVRGALKK